MLLESKEIQACAYLFQKTNNSKFMEGKLIKAAGDLTATRADLQCLLPNKVISDLVFKTY
jgi:hypothetical protein